MIISQFKKIVPSPKFLALVLSSMHTRTPSTSSATKTPELQSSVDPEPADEEYIQTAYSSY
jgi:hypothetical protein